MGSSKHNEELCATNEKGRLSKGKQDSALQNERNYEDGPEAYPEEPARVIEERMASKAFPDRSQKGRGGHGS